MRNQIPYTHGHGANWAAEGIEAPFFFLPNAIATGTVLATTGLPVISNIATCPATFTVFDVDSSADNNEGFWTSDGVTDADYAWNGAGAEAAFIAFGKSLLPAGTVNGIGGGVMLISLTYQIQTAEPDSGSIFSFGNRVLTAGHDGLSLGVAIGSNAMNFAIQKNGVSTSADVTAASVLSNSTPHKVAILIDARNGEILTVHDGVAVTPAGKATLLAGMDELVNTFACGFTFSGLNNSTTVGTRSITSSLGGRTRDVLLMNLSAHADPQALFYELANRIYRAPAYSLPRWMEGRF